MPWYIASYVLRNITISIFVMHVLQLVWRVVIQFAMTDENNALLDTLF